MSHLRRHIREYDFGLVEFPGMTFGDPSEPASYVQTDGAAACGAIIACSGAVLALTTMPREASVGGTPGVTGVGVSIPALSTGQAGIMFQSPAIGATTWPAGTWTIPFNHSATVLIGLTLEAVYVCRVNAACGVVGTVGSATGLGQNVTPVAIYTVPVIGVESVGAVDDSFYIVAVFDNSAAFIRTLTWTPDQTIDTPITVPTVPRRISIEESLPAVQLVGTLNVNSGRLNYATTGEQTVRTRVFNPQAVKQFTGFGATKTLPGPLNDPSSTTPTSITWRVSDGTTDRYWDGGAWSPATDLAHYNTEADVNTNLSTFPVTARTIQFIARLATTDKEVTPTLRDLAFGMQLGEYDEMEDLIARTFIPYIRGRTQFAKDYIIENTSGAPQTVFSFAQAASGPPEARLTLVGADAAFNHTSDAVHDTDILASFSTVTFDLTLTTPIPAGEKVFVRLQVEPPVIFAAGDQDYIEVARAPAVVIETMTVTGNPVSARRTVTREADGEADVLQDPYSVNVELGIVLLAEKGRSLFRLMDRGIKSANESSLLTSTALDEDFRVRTIGEGTFRMRPNLSDSRSTSMSMIIEDFLLWRPAEIGKKIITTLNFQVAAT